MEIGSVKRLFYRIVLLKTKREKERKGERKRESSKLTKLGG